MNRGEVDYAERKAMEQFDKWNDVTGCFPPGSGYYAEIQANIYDAVHIGLQCALKIPLRFNEYGELLKESK